MKGHYRPRSRRRAYYPRRRYSQRVGSARPTPASQISRMGKDTSSSVETGSTVTQVDGLVRAPIMAVNCIRNHRIG